jgi:hypothetical protein
MSKLHEVAHARKTIFKLPLDSSRSHPHFGPLVIICIIPGIVSVAITTLTLIV